MPYLTTTIDGYWITIEHSKVDVLKCYLGNGGVNIWPILNNEFRLKVFHAAIPKEENNK